MNPDEIKEMIEATLSTQSVAVTGDGSMFDVIVVSDDFEGKTPVKKQQMVYACVNEKITSGDIHALTIKSYTAKEWKTASQLQISS